jgi:Cu(I)/Ag(I) efflux system membrane fusion protein
MKTGYLLLVLAAAGALAAGGYAAYRFGMSRGMQMSAASSTVASSAGDATRAGAADPATGKKALYWYDPMHPEQRFDKPGKSPFMDMQLVPKYADEKESGGVTVSAQIVQSLGVRTAEARMASLAPSLRTVGTVEYNERSFFLVQPRAGGFIERLHVRAVLDPVKQGDPLVDILLPDWAAAQEEYLLLRQRGDAPLASAARQRLVLLGMSDEQIAAVERSGTAQPRITLRAPVSGVIAELGARQGMTVAAGANLFRIASLGSVWVVAEIPETRAAEVLPGARAEVHPAAYPNEKFAGKVDAILPEINATTRTVRTRIEVANPGGKLKPGMYASVDFAPRSKEALVVPSDAVIRTGARDVVIVAQDNGQFRPVEVEAGLETNDGTEIRKGLKAGERVVVSGQFLIDSEASLRSALDRLATIPGDATPRTHPGKGTVLGVDAARGHVELEHEPIPGLKWPGMRMGFAVEDRNQLAKLRKGDRVDFELREQPNGQGDYVLARIVPAGAAK